MLTGIAIGILIAPAKGSETRRRIVDRFNDFTEDLSEDAHDLYASGKGLIDEVRTDAQGLASGLRDIAEPL